MLVNKRYEDNAIKSLVKKFEENYEQSQKINSELSILLSSPLKAIEVSFFDQLTIRFNYSD